MKYLLSFIGIYFLIVTIIFLYIIRLTNTKTYKVHNTKFHLHEKI